ncbi:MAG: hypothetical protein Q9190_002314, partial [Brigantiaea leucoxantha]
MNDDSIASPTANETAEKQLQPELAGSPHNVNGQRSTPRPSSPSPLAGAPIAIRSRDEKDKENGKSDSEAETVVLPGQEEACTDAQRKTIKHEDLSDNERDTEVKVNGFHEKEVNESNGGDDQRRPSLKRKRAVHEAATLDEHGNSSNLSSTVSSPAPQDRSSRGSASQSYRSRSTPPLEEDPQHKHVKSRKRKPGRLVPDHNRQKRGKSDPDSIATNKKERRETRSATHNEGSRNRSESPPLRRHNRAQSTQSVDLQERYKRKRAPPPLLVERRRKASEDINGESDDSSSVHSHPHLQKVASIDHVAMSPAKLSQKTKRDRSGRTPLARACANDMADAVKCLRDRPEERDIPDFAGNTPLQIASLEGYADIVKLLLDAGCDITSKNIDMETPLIDAVENGHLEVVRLLLGAGADPRQSNAKGEEPLDLVKPENDDYDEIRAALMTAKEKGGVRRPSDDHSRQHRDNESAASPTDGPLSKSSPPLGPGARRRTARSQQTEDKLLWVNANPETLRNAAEKGDLIVIDHILRMRPEVHTEAVIAAARAGHDVVLEIFFAIGKLDQDPEPAQYDHYGAGINTPMLAAIGRGHIAVIRLLLSQHDFNPTRRLFKNLTYYELAKERKGSDWEEEFRILREAFDDFKTNGGRRSNHGSPRKVRSKKLDPSRSPPEASKSPQPISQGLPFNSNALRISDLDVKNEHGIKASSHKHLKPSDTENSSALLSDRDSEISNRPKPKSKLARSVSEAGLISSKGSDNIKPRRKLLSRNDLKSDQDIKRRASLAIDASSPDHPRRKSGDLVTSNQGKQVRKHSDSSISVATIRRDGDKDAVSVKSEPGKKRPRISASPQPSVSHPDGAEEVKKKKKRRVDSEGNAIMRDSEPPDPLAHSGPAMIAVMIPSPVTSPTSLPGVAPIAFMGNLSPVTKSPTEIQAQPDLHSPMSGIEQTLQHDTSPNEMPKGSEDKSSTFQGRDKESEGRAEPEKKSEKRQEAEALQDQEAQIAHKEADRLERIAQEEESHLEKQQQEAEEAERQARRAQEEEEARIEKRRREERRRIEQERARKEEQERRRAEQEERERLRRIRMQEEEEQQRTEALPNSLRRAAELDPDAARQPKEIKKWLPL